MQRAQGPLESFALHAHECVPVSNSHIAYLIFGHPGTLEHGLDVARLRAVAPTDTHVDLGNGTDARCFEVRLVVCMCKTLGSWLRGSGSAGSTFFP
jgi:hypothetical protein